MWQSLRTLTMVKPPWLTACSGPRMYSAKTRKSPNAYLTQMIRSASAALPFSLRTSPSITRILRSTLSTPPVMPTLVARWSAFLTWQTAHCSLLMLMKAPSPRPVSFFRMPLSVVYASLLWSTRSTAPMLTPMLLSTRYST